MFEAAVQELLLLLKYIADIKSRSLNKTRNSPNSKLNLVYLK